MEVEERQDCRTGRAAPLTADDFGTKDVPERTDELRFLCQRCTPIVVPDDAGDRILAEQRRDQHQATNCRRVNSHYEYIIACFLRFR